MTILQAIALTMAALGGLAVVATRHPLRQSIMVSLYGLILSVLFFAFQAPDVALSELVVGAVILPLILLLTLAKIRGASD